MLPLFHRPRAPLNSFIECFWYFPAYTVLYQRERALPTGTIELVINLTSRPMRIFVDDEDQVGKYFDQTIVCGPHSRYFVIDTSHSGPVIGVHFLPGGAAPFLGLPAHQLSDQHVALEDLWGVWAREIRERLLEASSPAEMFRLLEEVLLGYLNESRLTHPAITYAIRRLTIQPAASLIGQIETETGYGAKRFIELFTHSVGLTPKVYSRIQRFQSVLNRVARGDRIDWASVALDAGYCDQSHLIRDFRIFSGTTPTLYDPLDRDRPNHLAAERK